jgi:hypothetical protein
MRFLFRAVVALGSLGLGLCGCNRSSSTDSAVEYSDMKPEDAPFQAAFRVPGMSWAVGWPGRVRKALATLPWVEQGTITMDFKSRELKFGLKESGRFDADAVKKALAGQGFASAEWLSGP